MASSPQPSTADVDRLVPRTFASIDPEDLPAVSPVSLNLQPSTAPLQDDGPVKIHNCSVEEYQRIYTEVVEDMLRSVSINSQDFFILMVDHCDVMSVYLALHRYKNGKVRPWSLKLGRRIKQRLWERMNRPTFTTSAGEDGLVHVDLSCGTGVQPPNYDVDTSEEPEPKRARNQT